MKLVLEVIRNVCILLLLLTAGVFAAFEYGSAVSRRAVFDLQIAANRPQHPQIVTIDGKIANSSMAVRSVQQHRSGRCIVVVVRESLDTRHWRSGEFHLDVPVQDGIDEIAFGNRNDVIWHR